MSSQLICDECHEPIDQDQPYYQVTGVKQQMVDGVLTVVEAAVQVDFHEDHLPWNLPEPTQPQQQSATAPSSDVPVFAPPAEEPTQ